MDDQLDQEENVLDGNPPPDETPLITPQEETPPATSPVIPSYQKTFPAAPAEDVSLNAQQGDPLINFVGVLEVQLRRYGSGISVRPLALDADERGGKFLISASDLSFVRYIAGELLYAGDGREWKFLGSGTDGDDGTAFCAVLHVTPLT